MTTDLRTIIETMAALDELVGKLHRACQVPASKDGRTILDRIRDDTATPLRAVSYDPPSRTYRPPTDEQLDHARRDPEALTPPVRSDPTGEAAIRSATRRTRDPLNKILAQARRALDLAKNIEDTFTDHMPHEPTPEELAEARKLETVNAKPRADDCQHCARWGIDVPFVAELTNLAAGVEGMRICAFCKAHVMLDECPTCGRNPGLPTRKECEIEHGFGQKRIRA